MQHTMRFLTAYFAVSEGSEVILTGSQRMQERPIKVLVEALEQLG
jgi:3-phosphoshikimate 1-carboxyvinyltransferase